MIDWLDLETRAILDPQPPEKLAPADTEGFSLLVFNQGADRSRLLKTLEPLMHRGNACATANPLVLRQGLTLNEAYRGQFDLVCCDCASALVRDEVALGADDEHLSQIKAQTLRSTEFQQVRIELLSAPDDERGRQYLWQFLGLAVGVRLPFRASVYRKKARLMRHWAWSIGAEMLVER